MARVRRHVFLYGRVQMVGFRYYIIRLAERHGMKGFVRNLPDGSLEIVIEGEQERVSTFIAEAKKGPPAARVEKTEVINEKPAEEFDSFTVRY